MEKYSDLEIWEAINSCKTFKKFILRHRKIYYFINYHNLEFLYEGIYFYDKLGVINICRELYGDLYDLSEFLNNGVRYSTVNDKTVIPVFCKKHGRVKIPLCDLLSGVGCHKCVRDRRNEIREVFPPLWYIKKEFKRSSYTKGEILDKIIFLYDKKIHFEDGDKLYTNIMSNTSFVCKYHGCFVDKVKSLLNGSDCPYCNLIKKTSLILSCNGVKHCVEDGIVKLANGLSIGFSGDCDIILNLECDIHEILSSNSIIYKDDFKHEKWGTLDGYSNYRVSNLGRVYSVKKDSYLFGTIFGGRKSVTLKSDLGAYKAILLHRLVYIVFKGEIPTGFNIDHLDGNPLNNRLCNLSLCENIRMNINNEITKLSKKIFLYNRRYIKKSKTSHNYDVSSLDGEMWVDSYVYGDMYEVSNMGRVRSKKMEICIERNGKKFVSHIRPKLLKLQLKGRYLYVGVCGCGKRMNISVHKLVYQSFKGKVPEGLEIDHINGNCLDNNLDNLQALNKTDNLKKRRFVK